MIVLANVSKRYGAAFAFHLLTARPGRTTVLVAMFALLLMGCQPDPCEHATPTTDGPGGDARLIIPITGQRYSPGRAPFPIACVDVLLLDPGDYTDTLAAGRVQVRNGHVHINQLPPRPAAVIIGGERFFPVKRTDVPLRSGRNRLGERLFMYRSDADFHASGWVDVEFRPGSTGDDIRAIYSVYDHIEVHDMGPSYRLRFTSASALEADVRLQRLCRRLLESPHVLSARPVVDFNLMYPAGAAH